jgi:Arc/MetJ-type ribon-helix-helix transcriptional regulator
MASISLSLDRDLTNFVQSQITTGVAVSAEDYLRHLVKREMLKCKENKTILQD